MLASARLLILALLALTAGCSDPEAAQRAAAAQAAQVAARQEALANEALSQLQAVRSTGKEELAYAFAQDLLSRYPNTQAGRSVQTALPELKQRAEQVAEQRRLESLWTYHAVEDKEAGGTVYTAYAHATRQASERLPDLRLVLRRHPAWGQSVYLLADGGDFQCQDECRMDVTADAQPPHKLLISRAKGANPPAIFLEEDAKALDLIDRADRVVMAVVLADGKAHDYLFEVAALDSDRLGPAVKR